MRINHEMGDLVELARDKVVPRLLVMQGRPALFYEPQYSYTMAGARLTDITVYWYGPDRPGQ